MKLVYKEHNLKSIHNLVLSTPVHLMLKLVYKEHNLKSIHNTLFDYITMNKVEISI
mgnify:FL=1